MIKNVNEIENRIKYIELNQYIKNNYYFGKHLNNNIKNVYSMYNYNEIKNKGSKWKFNYLTNYILIGEMFKQLVFVEVSNVFKDIIFLTKNFILVADYIEDNFKNITSKNITKYNYIFHTCNIEKIIELKTFKFKHDGNFILTQFKNNKLDVYKR